MKSKMFAKIMIKPERTNRLIASPKAAVQLIRTPINVSVFGEMPSATLMRMTARSGNMQMVPMVPVNVVRWRVRARGSSLACT